MQVFSLLCMIALLLISNVQSSIIRNDYAVSNKEQKTARVVNGNETAPGAYPHQAFLKINVGLGSGQCGGSLIAPSLVLTAAHCLVSAVSVDVILGCDDVSQLTPECEVFEKQTNFDVPREYRNAVYGFDYAVIVLDTPSTHTPINLPAKGFNFIEGLPVTLSGYGKVEFDEPVSNRLMEANLFLVSHEDCAQQYNNVGEVQTGRDDLNYIIEEHHICAMGNDATACMGDSGGPLAVTCGPGGHVQFGVVSFGFACVTSDIPAVYHNLLRAETIEYLEGFVPAGESLSLVSDLDEVCNPEPTPVPQDMEMIDADGWTCRGRSFATGDRCDCNCGIRDPDCDWDTDTVCDAQAAVVAEDAAPYKVALGFVSAIGAISSVVGFFAGRMERAKRAAREEEQGTVNHFLKNKV